jgi:large subunit ribosomal protein L15
MRPNDLTPVPGSVHKKKRIGRGNASGHGTYSTRGLKGQHSRSGPDLRIGFEGGQIPLVRALSRKRGFNNKFRVEFEPVNVELLSRFDANSTVDIEALRKAGLVKSSRMPVKVLGNGDLNIALKVEVDSFSASARAKIEAAGGTATALRPVKVKAVREAAVKEAPAEAEETPVATVAAEPEAAAPAAEEAPARRPRTRRPAATEEPETETPAESAPDTETSN